MYRLDRHRIATAAASAIVGIALATTAVAAQSEEERSAQADGTEAAVAEVASPRDDVWVLQGPADAILIRRDLPRPARRRRGQVALSEDLSILRENERH